MFYYAADWNKSVSAPHGYLLRLKINSPRIGCWWLTDLTYSVRLTYFNPLELPRPEYSGIYCDLALFGTAVL